LGFAASDFFTACLTSFAFFTRSLISLRGESGSQRKIRYPGRKRRKAHRSAFSRAAARTSDFSLRRFWMTSRDAPTIERVCETLFERRLRRAASVDASFLCALRYSAVHASLAAFSLLLKRRLHLAFRNRKTCGAQASALSERPRTPR